MSAGWLALVGVGTVLGLGAVVARPGAAVAATRPGTVTQPTAMARQIGPPPTAHAASDPALTPGVSLGGGLLNAGKQLVDGNLPGAAGSLVGGAVGAASSATTAVVLASIDSWVVAGAQTVLNDTGTALGATTSPRLQSTWFSSTYWRMAAIATVLTLPFLFAAAVQALIRSDLALLARATFGYLPLAMLAIAIAAPLTTLLLSAGDELSSFISSAAGHASAHFLAGVGIDTVAFSGLDGSAFMAFLVGLFLIATAFALWVELLLREAAVYVIVLMLPLAFAALVWPARRVWAIRAVELLVALILSKFAIVAVLSLGGAALGSAGHSLTALMAGAVLIMLAAFSPWVLLRLMPLAEVASGVGELRSGLQTTRLKEGIPEGLAHRAADWVASTAADMKRHAELGATSRRNGGQPPDDGLPPAPGTRDALSGPELPAGPRDPLTGPEAPAEPRDPLSGPEPRAGEPQAQPPGAPRAHPAEDARPQNSVVENWKSAPVLDLENVGSTPVYPHPDAE